MPKVLTVGENCLTFDVYFNNVKSAQGNFINANGKQLLFAVKPSIQLSVDQNATSIPYIYQQVKTGTMWTGVIVKFTNFFTGNVTVTVLGN